MATKGPTITGWSIARSGPTMTIIHDTGKLVGVKIVGVESGKIVAYLKDGSSVELSPKE